MELVDSWMRSLRAAGRSPATLDAYRTDVGHFAAWYGSDDIEKATNADVEKFVLACLDRGLAPATVARRYRSLQQLFRWLTAEAEIADNPMARMKPPTIPVTPPPIMTDDDLRRLLAACRSKPNHGRAGEFERRRDTAMVLILATTGIRAGELVGLTVGDVNFAHETITVVGKGNRMRIVALLPQPAEAVDRYLRVRRRHARRDEAALWLGEKGPLGYSGLRQMLERRCHAAGIDPIHPHLFRHRFAHIARVKGMGDSELMAVAGWNSNQMLNRYGASAAAQRGREAHRALFSNERL